MLMLSATDPPDSDYLFLVELWRFLDAAKVQITRTQDLVPLAGLIRAS
jgi:hypothetical protein